MQTLVPEPFEGPAAYCRYLKRNTNPDDHIQECVCRSVMERYRLDMEHAKQNSSDRQKPTHSHMKAEEQYGEMLKGFASSYIAVDRLYWSWEHNYKQYWNQGWTRLCHRDKHMFKQCWNQGWARLCHKGL